MGLPFHCKHIFFQYFSLKKTIEDLIYLRLKSFVWDGYFQNLGEKGEIVYKIFALLVFIGFILTNCSSVHLKISQ